MLPSMIYLNGPAGSGKTTLANLLQTAYPSVAQVQFPLPLWEIADSILHQSGQLKDTDEPFDFASQDIKASIIEGSGPPPTTWRDFLIEQGYLLRKHFGPDILSRIAAQSSKTLFMQGIQTIIYPNVRTMEDLTTLIPLAPKREQVLIRLEREGKTWDGDLGGYLDTVPFLTITLSNNSTPEELLKTALHLLEEDPSYDR